jgi:hypothetical protein
VLDGKMIFPVIGQALVECTVLMCNVLRIASPDGFRLVELLIRRLLFLDLLCLLLLGLVVLIIDFFDLGLLTVLGFFLSLVVLDFL